jgi:lipoyl(octanoyl) transferase
VFVSGAKVAAIGVQVRRWVSLHGFALNIDTDLSAYGPVVPCGIHDRRVTSLAELASPCPSWGEVAGRVAEAFGEAFGRRMVRDEEALRSAGEGRSEGLRAAARGGLEEGSRP